MSLLEDVIQMQGHRSGTKVPSTYRGGLIIKDDRTWYLNRSLFKDFLLKLAEKGYINVLAVYPVYHLGWEMDNWGAIVKKEDGEAVRVETNHGVIHETK